MDDEILAPLEEVITMASRSSANERTTNDKASVDLGHHSVASLNLSNDTATSTTSDSPSERPPERFLEDKWHSRWRDDFQRDFKAIQAFQEWYDWREKSVGRIWLRKLLCYFTFQSPPKRPQIEHLQDLIRQLFLPRDQIPIRIFDFYDSEVQESYDTLHNVEKYWKSKPEHCKLRWIHAPVGPGDFQSFIRQMFWEHISSFDIDSDSLTFEMLEQLDHGFPKAKLTMLYCSRRLWRLNSVWRSLLPRERHDGDGSGIGEESAWERRILDHGRFRVSPWRVFTSDVPYQLGELRYAGFGIAPAVLPIRWEKWKWSPMFWSSTCRSPLSCNIDRHGGILLTFSSSTPVGSIITGFDKWHCQQSRRNIPPLEDLWSRLDAGTLLSFPDLNPYLLCVYLAAQLSSIPEMSPKLSLQGDWTQRTQSLVNQRRLFLSKDSGRHIFEQHIEYLDDLSQLLDALEYKEEYLRKFFIVERQDPTHDRLTKMIELAISDLQVARKQFSKLVEDLRTNLNIGFQLRTISQNEATLLAESNNRAILVFTLVTIIFLPLSFFTSYYGMNLPDVAKTDKTQAWFWKVCGTSTFGIVGLTILFGFKNRWTEWLFWTVAREWDIRDETVDLSDYYG